MLCMTIQKGEKLRQPKTQPHAWLWRFWIVLAAPVAYREAATVDQRIRMESRVRGPVATITGFQELARTSDIRTGAPSPLDSIKPSAKGAMESVSRPALILRSPRLSPVRSRTRPSRLTENSRVPRSDSADTLKSPEIPVTVRVTALSKGRNPE